MLEKRVENIATVNKRIEAKNRAKIKSKNKSHEKITKNQKIMNGVALWTSFYRANPHRFVEEYLGVELKLFQKILLFMMVHYNYLMYVAARGIVN